MICMFVITYAFFSLMVKTKMTAFTYIASAIGIIVISIGSFGLYESIVKNKFFKNQHQLVNIFLFGMLLSTLKPFNLAKSHFYSSNPSRITKLNNTHIYKTLTNDSTLTKDYILINCKEFEEVELMFYQDYNAYHWYPTPGQTDSLLNLGYKIAAFDSHTHQTLPEFIRNNPKIRILHYNIK